MNKYIKVEWPEIQKFQDLPNYCDECYEHESGLVTFVPENLYNEVINGVSIKNQTPRVYKNTSLGTVILTDEYAKVGSEFFWYDRDPQKNDKLLIYNKNTEDFKIVNCIANQEGFPILTDDKGVTIGIFDELIGSYDPETTFNHG